MGKGSDRRCKTAKVYFRCTPTVDTSWEYVKILDNKKTMYVRCLQDFLPGNDNIIPNYWCFETDGVFYNDSQRDIFNLIMPDVLHSFLEGSNAAVIAYGATGTGKSLTMSGINNSFEDRGLISRSIEFLLALREEYKTKMKISFTLSFVEATNTHIYDLLDENLAVYHTQSMHHISKKPINDMESVFLEIFKGEGRKSNVQKSLYDSHSSHSVLTITATCRLTDEAKLLEVVSKLHFVDLAGVDTVGNQSCFYKNVIEIGMANVTKTQIEQFVLALITNITENILVKQKLNILIQYLGKALSQSSQMRLIGHIRTGRNDLTMTLSMLRLSNIIRGVKGKRAEHNAKETDEGKINHLQETVNTMRQELEVQSMILNNTLDKNLTRDRIKHLQELAENYLSDKISELVVVSFSDISTILQIFKDRFIDLEAKKQEEIDGAYQMAMERAAQSFRTSSGRIPTMKSKDSVRSQSSKASKRSVSVKGSKDSKERRKSKDKTSRKSPSLSTKDQPSRQGSKTIRKGIKKRSSMSTEMKDAMSETMEDSMPSDVPSYDEAWNEFTLDEKYGYQQLMEQLNENETVTKDINVKYLTEIRALQEMRENLETKEEALRLAQMGREIAGVITYDDDGNMKISDAETECKNTLKLMEDEIVQQQENLLLLQTQLRLELEICRETRKSINDQYELFCAEHYSTLLPNLKEKSEAQDEVEQSGEVPDELPDDLISKDLSECYNNLVKYETLKSIMQQEKVKMKLREVRNKKWHNTIKI
nr:kinesin-like protein KIF9 [Onthophagus taurus]